MIGKYEDKYDDNNMICPYCGSKYQVESEDYSEDPRVEECDECGKKYHAVQSFSVTHISTPDCELNGESHVWEPVKIRNGVHDFCSICNKCKPITFDLTTKDG